MPIFLAASFSRIILTYANTNIYFIFGPYLAPKMNDSELEAATPAHLPERSGTIRLTGFMQEYTYGRKVFYLRYRWNGKRLKAKLGQYRECPKYTLITARNEADRKLADLKFGNNPFLIARDRKNNKMHTPSTREQTRSSIKPGAFANLVWVVFVISGKIGAVEGIKSHAAPKWCVKNSKASLSQILPQYKVHADSNAKRI